MGDRVYREKEWSVERSADLYRVAAWAEGYYRVSGAGHLLCCPDPDAERTIDVPEVVEALRQRGLSPPFLVRFPEILAHRVERLCRAFERAAAEWEYEGSYRAVFPIKVNQQRTVVEEVLSCGRQRGLGLEVGSKPELLAALALCADEPERTILCNGYKDERYVETVVLATKMGHSLILVVESAGELDKVLRLSGEAGVEPRLGARVKLETAVTGRWRDSVGKRAKFGLSVGELVSLTEVLREAGRLGCLELLHFHPGSQVQDISVLRETLAELAQIYVELVRMGCGLRYLDVGGGLGVDYRGRRANIEGSMNYDLEEYARTVVHTVGSACERAEVPHPTLISESGRAMVAHHGILIFDVRDASSRARFGGAALPSGEEELPGPVVDLLEAVDSVVPGRLVEVYHRASEAREEAIQLFRLGYLSLPLRGLAERLYHETCGRLRELAEGAASVPEELRELDSELEETYFCNLSVFQSLPDAWAIRQVFPVMPIHRLAERPTRSAILGDLTCDSDGRIDRFPARRRVGRTLRLHPLIPGQSYYLAALLVGAYQETLGDLHNLFGDTHVATVRLDANGSWRLDVAIEGDTASDVLRYVGYDVAKLADRLASRCERALADGRLTAEEARSLTEVYTGALGGYTYLEPE